jgi:hypothetical protein
MDTENWLSGWQEIGKYIGKSAKTAQRYAHDGMPFFRDPGGRPIVKPSIIDEYLVDLNWENKVNKVWNDKGIKTALWSVADKEEARKEFDEKLLAAQRPPRLQF